MNNSLDNKKNRSEGAYFENIIIDTCEYYKRCGLAYIEKTPEPLRVYKNLGNGKFVAFFEKKAQPDFKGTLKGGLSVVFEAKYTSKERIERSRLTDEQMSALELHHKLGAKAFILVHMGMQDFFRIPFDVWHDMKRLYGRQYMTKYELEKFCVNADNLRIQFLSYKGRDIYTQLLHLQAENEYLKAELKNMPAEPVHENSDAGLDVAMIIYQNYKEQSLQNGACKNE